MRRWRLGPIIALALLSGAAPARQGDSVSEADRAGPNYDDAAIRAFSFHGVRLDMDFLEACQALLANGYTRRTPAEQLHPCAVDERDGPDINFFGHRVTEGLPPLPPDSPAAIDHVRFFTLNTRMQDGRRLVRSISVYTDEPNRRAELAAGMRATWGRPTLDNDWGYTRLAYGASPRQADAMNRQRFDSCSSFPQCSSSQPPHGNCGTVFREFGTAHAEAVAFDWGRHLSIEDNRNDPRVAAIIRRRGWEHPYRCVFPL